MIDQVLVTVQVLHVLSSKYLNAKFSRRAGNRKIKLKLSTFKCHTCAYTTKIPLTSR